ncbi:MAG: 2-amino-4-hydroxy-6-hydroxymethyldihydropteridine diphosphokinase [PVC group bacterium]
MFRNLQSDAFLSLGSNRGDRADNIRHALFLLGRAPGIRVTDASALYESAPLYLREQAAFLNCVTVLMTELDPHQLLEVCKGVERVMGRERGRRYGPRIIDLDIVSYGRRVIRTPELSIPHPGLEERRFVLLPLSTVAPYWRHPFRDRSVRELLFALGEDEGVSYYGEIG